MEVKTDSVLIYKESDTNRLRYVRLASLKAERRNGSRFIKRPVQPLPPRSYDGV